MSSTRERSDHGPLAIPHVGAMKLAVGDVAVYAAHGVGRIIAREEGSLHGAPTDLVLLALGGGLTITLPLMQAREHLRPVAGEEELRRIGRTLRADRDLTSGPWLSRQKQLRAKLSASDPVQLAEIVVEGAQRKRLRLAAGNKQPLSPGEGGFFAKARELLAGEIAVARGLELDAAESWIDKQLVRSRLPGG